MTNAQHTPGPWTWGDDHPTYGKSLLGKNKKYVISGNYECGIEVSKPDADLIAAAPELLEALEYALPFLEPADDTNVIGVIAAAKKARAAIAKAKGETQSLADKAWGHAMCALEAAKNQE